MDTKFTNKPRSTNMNISFLIGSLLILFTHISLKASEKYYQINTRQFELGIKGHPRKLQVEIHAHKKNHLLIEQIESILRKSAPQILKYFSYIPRDTVHFVVEPKNDSGGQAATWPRNAITISPAPPLGREYVNDNDWLNLLVIHEFIHIVHIEQTHGILQFLRHIVGSLGKMGGVAPRWFVEGLAVWGESFFIPEGRLYNPSMEYELRRLFMDENFCKTIDCLDDPGVYPFARLPYWIGGYFLDFIEKNKKGSLACIVKENSSNLPFFLNNAFLKCLKMDVAQSFALFRQYYSEKIDSEQKKARYSALKKLPFKGDGDWQAGMALIQGGFHYLTEKNSTLQLAVGKENSRDIIDNFSHRLGMIPPASPYSKEKGILPMAVFNSSKNSSRKWILWNSQAKTWQKLHLSTNPQYLFVLSEKEYLLFNYHEHRWHISLYKEGKTKKIHSLPLLTSLESPQILTKNGRPKSIFRTYEPNGNFKLLQINPAKEKTRLLYSSRTPFDLLGACRDRYLIRKKKSLHLIGRGLDETIGASWAKGVFFWDHYNKQNILLSSQSPGEILSFKGSCNQLLQTRQSSQIKNTSLSNTPKRKKTQPLPIESYPSFRHFLPHYWGMIYGGGDTLDFWSFFTSMNDPMEIHTFNLNYNFYPSISQSTPVANYNYRINKMDWKLSYKKEYYKSSYTNSSYSTSETKGASLSFHFQSGNWFYTPTAFYDLLNVDDFISQRKIDHYGITQRISRVTSTGDGFFQQLHLTAKTFRQKTGNRIFTGLQGLFNSKLKWHRLLTSDLTATYGRLYKDPLSGGVIYGGGGNYYNSKSFHQFYGIAYTDAFGNEITTGRFQLDLLPFDIYRGWDLFPIFFKNIHILLGADYIEADYIVTNNRTYLNENLFSTHAGLRFQTTLAYMLPFSVDILYSKVHKNTFTDQASLIFVIKGGLIL